MKSTPEQLERARIYRESHREQIRSYFRRYHLEHREKQIEKSKQWRIKNGEVFAGERRLDRRLRRDYWRQVQRRYNDKRKRTPHLWLRHLLACRIRSVLKRSRSHKDNSTLALLGADIATVKRHIESLWLPGMSWNNWGPTGWHIDHIKPCASFDLTDPEQQKQCFHYTNLQPLWYVDNIRKGAK